VKSRFGVTYLYAASGLFKPVPFTRYAACFTRLRTSASMTAPSRVNVAVDTKVTVSTAVTGPHWTATCAGSTRSGTQWYRISAINGRTVKSAYGVSYLYAASGLFKSAPTATPPPPSSGSRPFAAPVTSRTVTVPGSIDATGGSNAGAALQSFINSQPDGTVINFNPGVYRLDRGLFISGRHNLVFVGNGATLRAAGSNTLIAASPFLIDGANSDIVVRGFVIEGNNPRTGTSIYDPGGENQQGVAVYGGARIEITGNTIRKTWGDAIYANEKDTTHSWVDGLWVHGNTITTVGRNGFTMNGAKNPLLEANSLDQIGGSVLDIEPDTSYQGVTNLVMRNNTVGSWGLSPLYTMHFVACANNTSGVGAVIRGISITGNRVTQGAPNSTNTNNAGGLSTWIGKSRTSSVVFTDNTTTKSGGGPVLIFEHIDGLTVRNNSQPVSSGSVVSVSDSTGVN